MTPSETTRSMTLHALHYTLAITMEYRGPVNFSTLLILGRDKLYEVKFL